MAKMAITKVSVKGLYDDRNAMAILGKARNAMKRAGFVKSYIDCFCKEAMSGDYDHLLQTVITYCDEWNEDEDGDD
jgi:hypothetical protein